MKPKHVYIFDKDTLQSHKPEDYIFDPDSDEILILNADKKPEIKSQYKI